ncbi:Protein of unknown function [Lactobacillus helveticus CIRM-BIA 951]|uniref:Uncharacterized protein n=2 Tax=Lactobacillus helveticus TaxID=1587 RepID=U6FCV1_LACHE|nr:Protein of unknown function [Lactobacillus helveticus CIRM-BIA 951]CDI60391.1 Protein of unknown function [Lactobacillus helveticus CIRM-BIA 104]CDI63187.1 Protein of unknown function [Lactobacillus helveticus CIRM-BIA 103]
MKMKKEAGITTAAPL